MKNISTLLCVLLLSACAGKADGNYSIDLDASKSSTEFQAENQRTNGGAEMGLQVFSQLAEKISINNSKFRLINFDCQLNSDLTKAECIDTSAPDSKKTFNFSSNGNTISISSDNYPVVYKNSK